MTGTTGNFIVDIIVIVVIIGSYMFGKYVTPRLSQDTKQLIENGIAEVSFIASFAEKFVVWAREFMKDSKGSEKMNEVVKQLEDVADKYGINMTKDQFKAIAQTAYENMQLTGNNKTLTPEEIAATAVESIKVVTVERQQTTEDPTAGKVEMLDDTTKVIKE